MKHILFILFIIIGIIIIGISIPLILEKIKPNMIYGFRTPKTLNNEAVWYKANKYSGTALLIAGIIMLLSAGIFYGVAIKLNNTTSTMILFIVNFMIFSISISVSVIFSVLYLAKL